jgi:hypothetical protein
MFESPEEKEPDPAAIVRTAQIIAIAMPVGVTIFLAVTLVLRRGKGTFAAEPWDVSPPKNLISLLGLTMAAVVVILSFAIPQTMTAGQRRIAAKAKKSGSVSPHESFSFAMMYMTGMIIGMALLEGGAFFNGICFLLEGHAPNLIVAAVLVLLILARFPTLNGIETWTEDQRRRLIEEQNSI